MTGAEEGVSFLLGANRPNPFNPVTTISYRLPQRADTRLEVYDVTGRLVTTLVDGVEEAGVHAVSWQGTDDSGRKVASGVYFYRLTSGDQQAARKMVMMQ